MSELLILIPKISFNVVRDVFSVFMSSSSIVLFLFLSCFAIYSFFLNNAVKGWTSLFLIISFFNTIIFLILGIMGECIGRLYQNSKEKPLYFVEKTSEDNYL